MYVIILGAGSMGLNLAYFLISDDNNVVIIESDDKKCQDIGQKLDALVICGNGTNKDVLKEANIDDADVFVAATGNDEVNLFSCLLVKESNVPKIFARVSDSAHEEVFKKAGFNSVISPEITAANYLEKLIMRPCIADLVTLGKGGAELLDFTVDSPKSIGKRVGDLSPNDDFIIVAINENGNIIIPKPDMVLKEGMRVSALVKTKFAKDVLQRFIKL